MRSVAVYPVVRGQPMVAFVFREAFLSASLHFFYPVYAVKDIDFPRVHFLQHDSGRPAAALWRRLEKLSLYEDDEVAGVNFYGSGPKKLSRPENIDRSGAGTQVSQDFLGYLCEKGEWKNTEVREQRV